MRRQQERLVAKYVCSKKHSVLVHLAVTVAADNMFHATAIASSAGSSMMSACGEAMKLIGKVWQSLDCPVLRSAARGWRVYTRD